MSDDESATTPPKSVTIDELFEQIEKAKIAREQVLAGRVGRRLIVPFSDTIPSERLDL